MSTVIDLQQIVAGRTNDKGRVYFSFLGEDPITGTKIDIYADPLFVKKINPDNDGGHKLGANGLVIDLATGLTYRTVYVQTPGYSVQMLDSYGVPLFNPFRQVGAEQTLDNLPLPYETLFIDPSVGDTYRLDKNLIPGLTGQTNVAVLILDPLVKQDIIFEIGSDLWNDIPEGGQINFYLYNSLLPIGGLNSGIAFEITPGEEFSLSNPDGYKLAFNENYLPAFNITSDLGQVVTVTKIINNNFLLTGDLDPVNPAVSEAPIDGNSYVRKDGAWEVASGGAFPEVISPFPGNYSFVVNNSVSMSIIMLTGTNTNNQLEIGEPAFHSQGKIFRVFNISGDNAIFISFVGAGTPVNVTQNVSGIAGYNSTGIGKGSNTGVSYADFTVVDGEWVITGNIREYPI